MSVSITHAPHVHVPATLAVVAVLAALAAIAAGALADRLATTEPAATNVVPAPSAGVEAVPKPESPALRRAVGAEAAAPVPGSSRRHAGGTALGDEKAAPPMPGATARGR